jgi:hypothetical protein
VKKSAVIGSIVSACTVLTAAGAVLLALPGAGAGDVSERGAGGKLSADDTSIVITPPRAPGPVAPGH